MKDGLLSYSIINDKSIAIARTYALDELKLSEPGRPDIESFKHLCERDGFYFDNLITAEQVHEDRVAIIERVEREDIEGVDALITPLKNVPLSIFTADCVAGFILDTKTPSIGIFHAGWRGTLSNIAGKTVETAIKHFKSVPKSIYVALSPSIKVCCYSVSDKRARDFIKAGFRDQVVNINRVPHIDMQGIIRRQIIDLGIPKENIYIHPHCTFEMENIYPSYRRDSERASRMVNIIMLK
ncbi:MAG TPA: peptidoglycan editing factor PgeF [Firmicutes bacterium]|nr:peptidoglycan editing factor PgeF [Bacillota bacterium]